MVADYLIYLTAGYDPEFSKLTQLCIQSIREHNDMSKIDIVILCDKEYSRYLVDFGSNIHITETNTTAMMSSMRKLEIFSWPKVKDYKRVLFLDSDIIVSKSLIPIFESADNEHILYVFEESYVSPHGSQYFSLLNYTSEQETMLNNKNIKGFNCGQFLFTPNESMENHFEEILKMIKNHNGSYYYEQSFMNVYFNLRSELTNRTLLNEHIQLFPDHNVLYPTKTIVHFTGDCGSGARVKLNKMSCYYKLINDYHSLHGQKNKS